MATADRNRGLASFVSNIRATGQQDKSTQYGGQRLSAAKHPSGLVDLMLFGLYSKDSKLRRFEGWK